MIIKLTDLKAKPCQEYLDLFVNGEIDVYEAFEKLGQQWRWLFNNIVDKNIIISQFDPDKFNWKRCSEYLAQYLPENFDADKYNWNDASWAVAIYCPQFFDADKYNWEWHSLAVAKCCGQHFDADKYNWNDASWAVAKYCPQFLHLNPKTNKTLERG